MPALTDKTDSEKWQIFAAESTRTYMWQMGSRNRKTENISERSFSQISCERKRNKKRMAKKKQKKKHCSIFGVGGGVEVGVPPPNTEFCALHENIAQFYLYCSQC